MVFFKRSNTLNEYGAGTRGVPEFTVELLLALLLANSVAISANADKTGAWDPRNQDYFIYIGKTHSRTFFEQTVEEKTSVIAAQPNNADAYRVRGFAYFKLEKLDLAKADLEKSSSMAPQRMPAGGYKIIGECFAENDDLEQAIAYFGKAINVDPHCSDCYLRRAQAYGTLDKFTEALSDADRLVSLCPKEDWVYTFRASLNKRVGRYRNVVSDCTEAIRLRPEVPAYYAERAKAYETLGDKKLAELDRQRVNQLARKSL